MTELTIKRGELGLVERQFEQMQEQYADEKDKMENLEQ